MTKEGMSQVDIANELKLNRLTISRNIAKAKAEGRLNSE